MTRKKLIKTTILCVIVIKVHMVMYQMTKINEIMKYKVSHF